MFTFLAFSNYKKSYSCDTEETKSEQRVRGNGTDKTGQRLGGGKRDADGE